MAVSLELLLNVHVCILLPKCYDDLLPVFSVGGSRCLGAGTSFQGKWEDPLLKAEGLCWRCSALAASFPSVPCTDVSVGPLFSVAASLSSAPH